MLITGQRQLIVILSLLSALAMAAIVRNECVTELNKLDSVLNILSDPYRTETTAEVANIYEDRKIFPDFRSGPLDEYREKATFCYKRLNVLLEGEEHLRLKVKIV